MNTNESGEMSTARRCHIDRLAAVEMQLIMQMLDRHSLLRLARCSRRMHADADSDAAWSSQPAFEVRLERDTGDLVAGRFDRAHHGLQQAHLRAVRIRTEPTSWRELSNADITAMLTLPHITVLHDPSGRVPTDEWPRILHHSAVGGLTKLAIGQHVPPDIIGHLVHLSRLHTLEFSAHLQGKHHQFNLRPALVASTLSSLPALTSLGVTMVDDTTNSSILPAIAACTQLKRLRVVKSVLTAGQVRRFLTSAHLAQLERLELHESFFSPPPPAEEYAEAFAAMTHLRRLDLRMVMGINSILAGASCAPHLTTVEIVCNSSMAPSVATLQTLFAQTETTSRVQVTLRLPPGDDSSSFDGMDPRRFLLG